MNNVTKHALVSWGASVRNSIVEITHNAAVITSIAKIARENVGRPEKANKLKQKCGFEVRGGVRAHP